jgi:hypothetical protein
MRLLDFPNVPSPSSRTTALGLTQLLIETSTGHPPEGKARPSCKTDNLTAICELIA